MSHAPLDAPLMVLRSLPRGTGRITGTVTGNILKLVLDHPERAGAVSPGMMLDLHHIIAPMKPEDGTVVLLSSTAPRAFCAGGDLRSVRAHLMDTERAAAMVDVMTAALDRLSRVAACVVAAVEGPALGGGAELLTACDIVVVGQRARIGFVHAGLGVSPGWGGARRLVARVGRRQALKWLLDPAPRSAEDAVLEGMADHCVAAGTALEAARDIAHRFAATPVRARAAAARLAKHPNADERATFLDLWGGPDHRASLATVGAGR